MARRSLNKVFLMGNLTRDPVAKYTPNGTMICTFGIATNRTIKKSDGTTEELTEFINISSAGKLAEICYKLLAKGMLVFLEGELRTRSWESPTGEKQYRTEIRISDMILIDSKGKTGVGMSAGGAVPSEEGGGQAVSAEAESEMTDAELDELLGQPEEEEGKEEGKKEGKKEEKFGEMGEGKPKDK